jgi:hypothetical protein
MRTTSSKPQSGEVHIGPTGHEGCASQRRECPFLMLWTAPPPHVSARIAADVTPLGGGAYPPPTSPSGTTRTSRYVCYLAAFGVGADISPGLPNNRDL